MKHFTKSLLSISMMVFALFFVDIKAEAQTPGGPGSEDGIVVPADGNSPSPTVPFDGGLSLMLIASGIGYGAKRMKKV